MDTIALWSPTVYLRTRVRIEARCNDSTDKYSREEMNIHDPALMPTDASRVKSLKIWLESVKELVTVEE